MANPNIARIQTDNQEINRLQDAVKRGSEDVSAVARGNTLVDVDFTGGVAQEVPHKLGQKFNGATCVKCDATGADWLIEDSDVDNTKFVKITSVVDVCASFLVY